MIKFASILVKILLIYTIILLISNPIYAAKKRIRRTNTSTATSNLSYSSAKLSRTTNSVILYLNNLDRVNKIIYELSYIATGIPQGATGSIIPAGNTDSRDLYFGTCSKNVCTPHHNIANAQLVVRVYLKTGETYAKRYKIKI